MLRTSLHMPPIYYFIIHSTHLDYIFLTTGSYYIRYSPVNKKHLFPKHSSLPNYYFIYYSYYLYSVVINRIVVEGRCWREIE